MLHVDMFAHNKSGIAYRDGNRRSKAVVNHMQRVASGAPDARQPQSTSWPGVTAYGPAAYAGWCGGPDYCQHHAHLTVIDQAFKVTSVAMIFKEFMPASTLDDGVFCHSHLFSRVSGAQHQK
jgi:hypothetical protein